jgi:hypothetical protein
MDQSRDERTGIGYFGGSATASKKELLNTSIRSTIPQTHI